MFHFFIKLGVVFTLGNFSLLWANQNTSPKTVDVSLSRAYVPAGFDDNDRVQVALEGVFPNTCYRVGPHALRINEANRTITLQQQAYYYGGTCLQILVPFHSFIDVGLVTAGSYTLLDYQSNQVLGKLEVARSQNAGPDDFLYAPVTDAYLINSPHKNSLVLSGTFSDRCSELDEVKVQYQNHVLVVQPVMKRTERCETVKTRFLKVVELEKEIQGMYFLHVRSLNGQAINRMIDAQLFQ